MKKFLLGVTLLFTAGCSLNSQITKEGIVKEFYASGVLKGVRSYGQGKLDGICREYSEDGILKTAVEYQQNQVIMKNVYYPNGALWSKEIYTNGRLARRVEFDEEGYVKKEDKF